MSLLAEVRLAARVLTRNWAFSVVAVLLMATGMGGTGAFLAIANAVVFRPLQFPNAHELVLVWEKGPSGAGVSLSLWQAWQEQIQSLRGIAVFSTARTSLTGAEETTEITVNTVSQNFFSLLRSQPTAGRFFSLSDSDDVVVLNDTMARRFFGNSMAALGKNVVLGGRARLVAGTVSVPSPFSGVGAWIPLSMPVQEGDPALRRFRAVGRTRSAVSLRQATSELRGMHDSLAAHDPGNYAGWTVNVEPLKDVVIEGSRERVFFLFGASLLVFLLCISNLATLFLTRGVRKCSEIAVRLAMGATQAGLFRQFAIEGCLLAMAAGFAGFFYGKTLLRFVLTHVSLPRLQEVRFDAEACMITGAALLVGTLLLGIAPLAVSRRTNIAELLRGTIVSIPAVRVQGLLGALTGLQIAGTTVLLSGTVLMWNSLVRLNTVDLGFEPEAASVMELHLPDSQYPAGAAQAAFFAELLARIRAIPGIVAVGGASDFPISGLHRFKLISSEMTPGKPEEVILTVVTPDYLRAAGLKLQRGRAFLDSDSHGGSRVVVVSKTAAGRLWPGRDPVGHRLRMGLHAASPWHTVIGVVDDIKQRAPGGYQAETKAQIYLCSLQQLSTALSAIVVRSKTDPSALFPSLRHVLQSVDRDLPSRIRTFEQITAEIAGPQQEMSTLLSVFAAMAILIAVTGVYGVASFTAQFSTREIGIRMALGAQRKDILWSFAKQSGTLALLGLLAGLGGSLLVAKALKSLLFEVQGSDPATMAMVSVFVVALVLVAMLVPAKRACSTNPAVVLRES